MSRLHAWLSWDHRLRYGGRPPGRYVVRRYLVLSAGRRQLRIRMPGGWDV
jgi:hypothetical protein